jgi:peptidoglycan/xylan/chitin deacetylase (PgdA/CDA1 family)
MTVMIATYHAVAQPASPVSTPVAQLESDLAGLVRAGFAFVSLGQCADWVAGRIALPTRAVAITFDDAYESVVTLALPVLARFQVPATVFAIASRLGGDNRWPGQWPSIPTMRLADASGLRELVAGGLSIGAHSWTHAPLPHVGEGDLDQEIIASADRLEQVVGVPVQHFAYPYGAYGLREVRVVTSRFVTGVTTRAALVRRGASPVDLPRIDCHDLRVALALGIADGPATSAYLAARRAARAARRTVERLYAR